MPILIMDEPTSTLPDDEVDAVPHRRAAPGAWHRHRLRHTGLMETRRIADRVTVLRDGKNAGAGMGDPEMTDQEISRMVGRVIDTLYPKSESQACGLSGTWATGVLKDISFDLRRGRGARPQRPGGRRTDRGIRALHLRRRRRYDSGTIVLDGEPVVVRLPEQAVRLGIGYVPKFASARASSRRCPVRHNISMSVVHQHGRHRRPVGRQYIGSYGTATEPPDLEVSASRRPAVTSRRWPSPSGGRGSSSSTPTRGIDVGAKAEVHALIDGARGHRHHLVGSPRSSTWSDRILVVGRGQVARRAFA